MFLIIEQKWDMLGWMTLLGVSGSKLFNVSATLEKIIFQIAFCT